MPKRPTETKKAPFLEPYSEEPPAKVKYNDLTKTAKQRKAEKEAAKATTGKRSKKSDTVVETKAKAKTVLKPVARKVEYEKPVVKMFAGDDAITVERAMKMLGWQEESDNIKFTADYPHHFKAGETKVRLNNNVTNRPIYMGVVATLMQEHLRKRWRFNGEPIIIGKTGLVLNGQHTLIALVLAARKWAEKKGQYAEWWKTEPTMAKLAVFGIEEDDDTVNTMDTCKPRSLADVIYRSEYFATMREGDRKRVSRALDHAVRSMWHRTGASENAFSTRRTHAESLSFINRHPKLLECVKHIYEENGTEKRILSYLGIGYSAALLYLMGCSTTDPDPADKTGYFNTPDPTEEQLSWEQWEKAQEFWVLLAAKDTALLPVRAAIAQELQDGHQSFEKRHAVIVKAWNLFADGKKVTADKLELEYSDDDEGIPKLSELPVIGGIDIGQPNSKP